MEKIFDENRIPINESYIGYGKNDLSEMSKSELKKELERTERELNEIKDEIDEANSFPSYALKERLENTKWYKNKVENALANLSIKNESVETPNFIDNMIKDLDRKYERGIISKEYYESYVQKLNDKRPLYEENKKREKEMKEAEEVEKEKKYKRRHPFKTFKNKLSEYKTKLVR